MTAVAVVTSRCQGCGACLLTCPERAIRPAAAAPEARRIRSAKPARATEAIGPTGGPARLIVLEESCTGCGECVEVCPVDAIGLTRILGENGEKT